MAGARKYGVTTRAGLLTAWPAQQQETPTQLCKIEFPPIKLGFKVGGDAVGIKLARMAKKGNPGCRLVETLGAWPRRPGSQEAKLSINSSVRW
ncbi:hypothetical protein H105_02909 [Trichophyton soudanense CBS 452.61]|uniref:Uncharacterized protein n=1 Tax=Trichophyton soudanense CBS 452.61 TaxID=1215331 RepID=A0A022XYX8_TRISD|nr:hypothetical protein H105_02909 [Trichophyton soudanense CBS 452.61]